MQKKPARLNLEGYAAKPVLIFSGSLLVLSVALNNIGFKEVVDAYAQSIVHSLEVKECKIPDNKLELRIKELEKHSHKPQ